MRTRSQPKSFVGSYMVTIVRIEGLLLGAALVCVPTGAAAQVVITEIMYDLAEGSDSGHEWIEVYNTGLVSVTLSEWRLRENGTNHKIIVVQGSKTLVPNTYVVIADNVEKFKTDHPTFAGQLFDSAFSLSNAGEVLVLHGAAGADGGEAVYTSSMGGDGTGDSLQREPGSAVFMPGVPTPGAGIPIGGLVRTPQKGEKKVTTTRSPTKTATATTPPIVGTVAEEDLLSNNQVAGAAVAAPARGAYLWLLGVFAISCLGVGGVVLSRRIQQNEWEIEEIS